jgi:hypothetical protein
LVEAGWQDVDEARVEVVERTPSGITQLRFRLPHSLEGYAFLEVEGCRRIVKSVPVADTAR